MTRPVLIFLLITTGRLLTKKYLIEVANKQGDEGVDGADERAEGEGRKARKLQPTIQSVDHLLPIDIPGEISEPNYWIKKGI